MKRRVIKQGHNTLTITLPRKWCDKVGIKGGDEIDLEERDISLILNTEKKISLDRVQIDVTGLDRTSILYYIRSVYRRGYDEIEVRFNNPSAYHYRIGKNSKVISTIHKEVNRLVGVEIIDQKNSSCVIKDVSGDSFKDFDNILRKVFLLILDALNDMITGVKESKTILLEEIEEKHDTITKFASYCLRLLNKQGYSDFKKTTSFYMIIDCLDIITDIIKYAARALLEYKKKPIKESIEIITMIKDCFNKFYEIFYKFDLKKFSEMNELRDKTLKKIDSVPNKIDKKELVIITNMEHILEVTREISSTRMGLEY